MSQPSDDQAAAERALMDQFRDRAAREPDQSPRPTLPRLVAFALSLALVAAMLLGFHTFLTAVQKFMDVEVVDPAPSVTDPMPAFVVTPDVSPQPQADPDPRPSPAPAPETSPATPR
jgi:hypothetical protein